MIYVGINIAKLKHDCVIICSDGEILEDVFCIENSIRGFNLLKEKIFKYIQYNDLHKIKVELESTGHYSNNIISKKNGN